MKANEFIQEGVIGQYAAKAIAKDAVKLAPITLGTKLRSLPSWRALDNLQHVDPRDVRQHYDYVLHDLREITRVTPDPRVDKLVQFMISQRDNPSLGQVLQSVANELKKIIQHEI